MYLLEFKNTNKNDMDKTYKELLDYGIISKTYIMQTYSEHCELYKEYPQHFVKLKLTESNTDEMIDFLMDLNFEGKNVLVDFSGVSVATEREFKRYTELMHSKYNLGGSRYFDAINLSAEDPEFTYIVQELLNHSECSDENKFDFTDFMIRFKIHNGGRVENELGEYVGNVSRKGIFKILTNITSEHHKLLNMRVEAHTDIKSNIGLGTKLSRPWYYLGDEFNLYDVIEYKKRVFDIIKNTDSSFIVNMDDSIKKVLFESRYLPLGLIEKIENRNHRLFEKEWFINQVKEGSE